MYLIHFHPAIILKPHRVLLILIQMTFQPKQHAGFDCEARFYNSWPSAATALEGVSYSDMSIIFSARKLV